MNYNQNKKIAQITPYTLGVDIAKFNHVARAQEFRGMEPLVTLKTTTKGLSIFFSGSWKSRKTRVWRK
jgi:hypothetical protein